MKRVRKDNDAICNLLVVGDVLENAIVESNAEGYVPIPTQGKMSILNSYEKEATRTHQELNVLEEELRVLDTDLKRT